jgi:hypothetical protein
LCLQNEALGEVKRHAASCNAGLRDSALSIFQPITCYLTPLVVPIPTTGACLICINLLIACYGQKSFGLWIEVGRMIDSLRGQLRRELTTVPRLHRRFTAR